MIRQLFKLNHRILILGMLVIIGSLLIPLGLHAYNGFFSRYFADDFCTASILKREGLIGSQSYWYRNWSGRFSFTFAINLLELIGSTVVPFLPLLLLVVWISLSAWALLPIISLKFNFNPVIAALMIAILTVFSTVDQATEIIQSLYWQTGAITYTMPLLFFTLYIGLLFRAEGKFTTKRSTTFWIILATVIPFIAGGFSEISAVVQVSAIGIALLLASVLLKDRIPREMKTLLIAGLVGSLLSLVLVVIAPGNVVRRSKFAEAYPLLEIAKLSFEYGWDFFHKTLTRIYMTTFLSVVFPTLFVLILKKDDIRSPQRSHLIMDRILSLILVPIITLLLIVVCMAPSTYGTNSTPPGRAHILMQFVLTVGTITWGFFLGDLLKIIERHKALASKKVMIPIFILVLGLMLPSPYFSFRRTSVLVTPLMRDYAALWDSRNNMIQNAIAEGNLNPSVIPLPHLTGLPAMEEDPENWINSCVADLYGLNSIVAEDTSQ